LGQSERNKVAANFANGQHNVWLPDYATSVPTQFQFQAFFLLVVVVLVVILIVVAVLVVIVLVVARDVLRSSNV
jgi:hypothetical protein